MTHRIHTLLTLLLLTLTCQITQAADLPNILWITSEDNGKELGCYGDKYSVTPNIDALAAKGFRYTNCSSTAPVCAPARTTIISGVYPPATGGQHMRSHVPMPAEFKMYPQFLREAGYFCTNNSKEDYNVAKPGEVWHESSRNAHWKHREGDQPFFAIFNLTISHEGKIRSELRPGHLDPVPNRERAALLQTFKSKTSHDPKQVRLPPYHPDTPEVRKDWARYYDLLTMMDDLTGRILAEVEKAGLADDTIVFYYGDHGAGMPRHKRWTYQSGLSVPLIVHYPEKWKHLAPKEYKVNGESDRLVGFIDLAPTLLSTIGVEPPEWMQGNAFAGKFQTGEPKYSHGFRDRMDERIDCVRQTRSKKYSYLKNYLPHKQWGQYIRFMFVMPTTQVWHDMFHKGELNEVQSQFWQTKPAEELYDLENDPHEIKNLANDPAHADALAEMRAAHAEWSSRVKDIGLLPEYEIHKRANDAGVTPYEMGHNAELFDHKAIFEAANLATSLKSENLPKIVEMLSSKDSGVRYWGAIGLLTQGEIGAEAGHAELLKALDDESLIVQVTAAEALGRYGPDTDLEKVLAVLTKHCGPDSDPYLAIAAWNALDYLDDRAKSVSDQLRAISPKPNNPPKNAGNYSITLKNKMMADLRRSAEGVNSD